MRTLTEELKRSNGRLTSREDKIVIAYGGCYATITCIIAATDTYVTLTLHNTKPFAQADIKLHCIRDSLSDMLCAYYAKDHVPNISAEQEEAWQAILDTAHDDSSILDVFAADRLEAILPSNWSYERKARLFISRMAEAYRERRSDVADACDAFLADERIDIAPESRFIRAELPGGQTIEYDTLTTELSYAHGTEPVVWLLLKNHKYYNDATGEWQ